MKPTGFAVYAHIFVRTNLYLCARDHTALLFYRSLLQSCYKVNSGVGYCLALANDTCGLCCLRAYLCAHQLIRARSYVVIPPIGIAMGFLLQIRMSWLRALSKGCRCWCCELAERAFKTGGGPWSGAGAAGGERTGAGVSWLCALWRCRKLTVQAACILVPASRMSTGRGILPSYLCLCWCNLNLCVASSVPILP